MNWGWHWATSAPGAPDDIELARRVADYVASMPNRSRFVLGTHLYGMDWPSGGGPANEATALEYADVRSLVARHGAQPGARSGCRRVDLHLHGRAASSTRSGIRTPQRSRRRVRLARDRGLGVGFWRLGREDQRIWDDPLLAR